MPCSDETILLNLTALVASPVQPWGGGHTLTLARDPSASSNLLPIHSPSFLAPPLVGDGGPGWVRPLKRQFKAGRGSSDLLALSTIVTYGEWRVINWSSRSDPVELSRRCPNVSSEFMASLFFIVRCPCFRSLFSGLPPLDLLAARTTHLVSYCPDLIFFLRLCAMADKRSSGKQTRDG